MKLKEHLRRKGLTLTAFAELAGLEISTVHRATEGKVIPSRTTMAAIVTATGGAVQPNDFFDTSEDAG